MRSLFSRLWSAVRSWPKRYTISGAVALVFLIAVVAHLLTSAATPAAAPAETPHVTLATVASLASAAGPLPVTGSVSSLSQATILAETSGEITSLDHALGDHVAAGTVIAAFENASQRASVLQAQGAYNAAVAAGAGVSPSNINETARDAYTSAYNSLDSTLTTSVDTFYGDVTPTGPAFLIDPSPYGLDYFSREREALVQSMDTWHAGLATAATADPQTLLSQADAVVKQAAGLATDIATVATKQGSSASSAQLAALAAARAQIAAIETSITSAKSAYQSQGTSAGAGAAASIQEALGALDAAEANLEKTLVRSPISGTIVSLPVSQGDFVSSFAQVAVVSNPGALYVDVQVTPDDAKSLAVGNKATLEGGAEGVITFIAPAIDPASGKIEVKVGITAGQDALTDGQIVSLSLDRAAMSMPTTASSTLAIPLNAAKILPSGPVVFTVTASSTLAATPITLGTVLGDRVDVTAGLTPDLSIVTDARGLSAGETVVVDPD